MKVYKFGGTSVGSPERIKEVSRLITEDGEPKIVVLSAMSGTTNSLVEIADYLRKGNPEGASNMVNRLHTIYKQHLPLLYSKEETTIFSYNYTSSARASSVKLMRKPF